MCTFTAVNTDLQLQILTSQRQRFVDESLELWQTGNWPPVTLLGTVELSQSAPMYEHASLDRLLVLQVPLTKHKAVLFSKTTVKRYVMWCCLLGLSVWAELYPSERLTGHPLLSSGRPVWSREWPTLSARACWVREVVFRSWKTQQFSTRYSRDMKRHQTRQSYHGENTFHLITGLIHCSNTRHFMFEEDIPENKAEWTEKKRK